MLPAVILLLATCGNTPVSGGVPSADELFARLEGAFNALDSYEVEYEVTKMVSQVGHQDSVRSRAA